MAQEKLTPLMRQYHQVKEKHPDKILLFRMGDFYETFYDDAKISSRVLGITLTKRGNGAAAEQPLAGFPHHALNNYLHKLLKAGHRVAICEQLEDPKKAKGIVKRGITEIVTPGTAVQDQYLESSDNNYLAAVLLSEQTTAAALIDISTGEFMVFSGVTKVVLEKVQTLNVTEILVPENEEADFKKNLPYFRGLFTQIETWVYDYMYAKDTFLDHFRADSLKGYGLDDEPEMLSAAGVILHYVKENFKKNLTHINAVRKIHLSSYAGLDRFTVRNLELFQRLSGEKGEGTFFWALNNTVTAMGARLLKQWILQPLLSIHKINARLDIVSYFFENTSCRQAAVDKLKQLTDLQRLCAKISSGKVNPRELNTLRDSLNLLFDIESSLDPEKAGFSIQAPDKLRDLIALIAAAVTDNPPVNINQGNTFRDTYHPDIRELRAIAFGGKDYLLELQEKERRRLNIPKLKIGYNRVFGYYIEITHVHSEKVPADYIRKQTLTNSERYITPELKEYEERILHAEEDLLELETRLYNELVEIISASIPSIQINARQAAGLDIFTSFAELAERCEWVRPGMNDTHRLDIKAGRHPVVEALLPPHESYVPNDHFIDTDSDQILLITGPNMSGKSTYLRQLALIVLMAQIGCYVPADTADIGLVDKIFTRVGASDNLAFGESTFLTEMIETANILNSATPASLILLDEIGRGTSTYDGLSIAWSVVEYLHNQPGIAARTLFATHYHELTDLESILERVRNYNVQVKEYRDRILFMRKIIPGSADKSYGIYVAQMAGVPGDVVRRANEILHNLSGSDHMLPDSDNVLQPSQEDSARAVQLSIFSPEEEVLRKDISHIDVNNMTPVEALNALNELKKKI